MESKEARAERERAAELEAEDARDRARALGHQGECAACGKVCRLGVDGRVHGHRRELGELGGYKTTVNCIGSGKPPTEKRRVL